MSLRISSDYPKDIEGLVAAKKGHAAADQATLLRNLTDLVGSVPYALLTGILDIADRIVSQPGFTDQAVEAYNSVAYQASNVPALRDRALDGLVAHTEKATEPTLRLLSYHRLLIESNKSDGSDPYWKAGALGILAERDYLPLGLSCLSRDLNWDGEVSLRLLTRISIGFVGFSEEEESAHAVMETIGFLDSQYHFSYYGFGPRAGLMLTLENKEIGDILREKIVKALVEQERRSPSFLSSSEKPPLLHAVLRSKPGTAYEAKAAEAFCMFLLENTEARRKQYLTNAANSEIPEGSLLHKILLRGPKVFLAENGLARLLEKEGCGTSPLRPVPDWPQSDVAPTPSGDRTRRL